jgi:UPF0176 protein
MNSSPFKVAAFYQFAPFPQFRDLQAQVLSLFVSRGIKGSVLLAHEGINGTIAGTPENIDAVMTELSALTGLDDLEPKYATAKDMPFRRTKVRLKKEIVTIGDVPADPLAKVGQYVEPEDWNSLISDPDVILIRIRRVLVSFRLSCVSSSKPNPMPRSRCFVRAAFAVKRLPAS